MDAQPMRELSEVLRDEMVMGGRIKKLLAGTSMTIPEIAEALDAPSQEVMLWVMTLWRYGHVKDLPKSRTDDYFKYTTAE